MSLEFHALKDGPAPQGEVLLVRGEGAAGKFVYALAKYEPNQFHDGWLEYRFQARRDDNGALLWFRPTAWALLENADGR